MDILLLLDVVNQALERILHLKVLRLKLLHDGKLFHLLLLGVVQFLLYHRELHLQLLLNFLEAVSSIHLICQIDFDLVKI